MKKSALKEFIRNQIITELNIEDETKALEDYEAKLDAVIKKKEEAGLTELGESINLSDYNEDVEKAIDVGINIGSNFNEKDVMYYVHNNWMEGNISAEEAMKKINRYISPIREEEGPTKADIKKTQGLAKTKEELARVEKEMKTIAKKWSKAEGEEKEKLLNTLKNKTQIKKELIKLLDRV